jgi:glycosyltransferase involved in cell wall biosynthesis
MKILVISENIPKSDFSSGDRRFLGILQILALNHEVVFCIPPHQPWLKTDENARFIKHIESLGVRFLPINEGWFERTITEEKYDLGFFEFFWIAERYMDIFIAAQPEALLIVDSVDLHFAREETQARLGQISKRKARITRNRELMTYSMADITIAVSQEDMDRLKEVKGIRHVTLIANVVPTVPREIRKREPSLIFIGCYAWHPNVDAMKWFVEHVWPIVINEKTDAKLMLVGSRPPEEITSMASVKGVEVLGYVPETAPYLDAAAVSIAPLRYGGGMKGKVNEAFAHGLPVVATSIGAQGFNATHGNEMFIADTPEEFASCVLKLLNDYDLRQKMGLAGQQLNERICSPEVIGMAINQMMDDCNNLKKEARRKPAFWKIWNLKLNRFLTKYYWNKHV